MAHDNTLMKPPRDVGRPTKFDEDKKRLFIELLAQGNTIGSICEGMDISTATFSKAKAQDQRFAHLVEMAKRIRVSLVEDSLYLNALSGNTTAQIFYLCNRSPNDWKNIQRVDVRSMISDDVPSELTESDLDAQIQILEHEINKKNGNAVLDEYGEPIGYVSNSES